MHATAPKNMIATLGVRKRGLIRRSRSGSCWYWPIEYVSRLTPKMPALEAISRIVAASTPT